MLQFVSLKEVYEKAEKSKPDDIEDWFALYDFARILLERFPETAICVYNDETEEYKYVTNNDESATIICNTNENRLYYSVAGKRTGLTLRHLKLF